MPESLTAYRFLADQIIQQVKSQECTSLHYEKLASMLELVLDNPEVINILRKTPILIQETQEGCISFETAYQTHIIEGKKEFTLMTPMHSFALSWLHYLYH
jgi:peptide deformylase